MRNAILLFVLGGLLLQISAYAGMKNETIAITPESVQKVQTELDRDFGQLISLLDKENQERLKKNEEDWQKSLNEKIAAEPTQALAITSTDTAARVCMIERLIQQLKEKESSK